MGPAGASSRLPENVAGSRHQVVRSPIASSTCGNSMAARSSRGRSSQTAEGPSKPPGFRSRRCRRGSVEA